jgi:ADP-heptose:LPS heptosyltransferase
MSGKILVIRGGAIGDFILTLPVLAALRRQWPDTRLEVLGYPHIAQLALAGGLAHAVHPLEAGRLASFFAQDCELDARWAMFFAGFDLVISFLYDPDGVFETNVRRCSRGQYLSGPHRPNERDRIHAARVYLKPLERLAIFDADPVPRLPPTPADQLPDLPPLLALHPGSGSERKNWPEAQWVALLQTLAKTTNHRFLLVGGEVEGAKLDRLAALLSADRLQVARSLPLLELARRLASCSGFIGHDSGISHLAAAVGLPALVLWADTCEAVWRPQGEHVTLLKSPGGLARLEVQTVLDNLPRRKEAAGQSSPAFTTDPVL